MVLYIALVGLWRSELDLRRPTSSDQWRSIFDVFFMDLSHRDHLRLIHGKPVMKFHLYYIYYHI